jgi:3-hydroxyacyl-[acyl-carrier-protein] dehydratase
MRFYLVDKVTKFKKASFIEGIKNVSMTEPFFTYHFQRYPVMPGVLIIESMAQLAGLLLEQSGPEGEYKKAFLSIVDKTKFRFMVRPGDQLNLRAQIINLSDTGACCDVTAHVNAKELTSTRLTFSLQDVSGHFSDFLDEERKALVNTLFRDISFN